MNNNNPLYNPEIYGSNSNNGTLTISGAGPSPSKGDVHINPTGGNMGIGTTNPSNTLSVKGSVDISGNVGIGTTTPTNTLSVVGSSYITGALTVGGNTAVSGSISGSQFIFPSGAVATSVMQNMIMLSGSGNWTVPKGITSVKVTLIGGGGAGGNAINTIVNIPFGNMKIPLGAMGGGGGSGEVVIAYLPVTSSQTINYSVGSGGISNTTASTNGGHSTFLNLTASGGLAGSTSTGDLQHGLSNGPAGAGGSSSAVQNGFSIAGQTGSIGRVIEASHHRGGAGGSCLFGYGGSSSLYTEAGISAYGYGAGGSGASIEAKDTTPALSGGGGANGMILIEY